MIRPGEAAQAFTERGDVAGEGGRNRDLLDRGLEGQDRGGIEQGGGACRAAVDFPGGVGEQDALLDLRGGQVHPDRQQEAVELRLRQREGAVAVGVVLGGDDEKRRGQPAGDAVERHLLLVHALEQRALDARRGAVDLVRQHAVGEDRAGDEFEIAAVHPVERVAEEVGRQQVGRELHALERPADRGGQGVGERGLADARRAFDQHVAAGEQGGQQQGRSFFRAEHGGDKAFAELFEGGA